MEQARSSARLSFSGLREDVRAAMLKAAPLRFFVHDYRGDPTTEVFSLTDGGERTELESLETDVVYRLPP